MDVHQTLLRSLLVEEIRSGNTRYVLAYFVTSGKLIGQRILLLSGPAGAGKTTTVRVVAKEMCVELMEWGEGADDAIVGAGVGKLARP
jgi:Holliday junction resolvasome RuvABC ATP-dependent DNA helicase subunit